MLMLHSLHMYIYADTHAHINVYYSRKLCYCNDITHNPLTIAYNL